MVNLPLLFMKRILQCYLLLSKMVIEIVNFPINSMVIFQFVMEQLTRPGRAHDPMSRSRSLDRWIDALRKYARGDFVNILMGVEDAPEAGIIFWRFLEISGCRGRMRRMAGYHMNPYDTMIYHEYDTCIPEMKKPKKDFNPKKLQHPGQAVQRCPKDSSDSLFSKDFRTPWWWVRSLGDFSLNVNMDGLHMDRGEYVYRYTTYII